MLTRRGLLAGTLTVVARTLACASMPLAQALERIFRVVALSELPRFAPTEDRWRSALRTRGYVEGQNLMLDFRWGDGRPETIRKLAADVAAGQPDVVLTTGTPAALAAKQATKTIPIVTISGDPIREGLVAALSRPGGNVTGVFLPLDDLAAKRVQLLSELVPNLRTVAILSNPSHSIARSQVTSAEAAARARGITAHRVDLARESDVERAFAQIVAARADGVIVTQEAVTFQAIPRLSMIAAKHRLPASHAYREFAEAGGLMSYGVTLQESMGLAAISVDRILKGANPAELPVQVPTKFELVLNMKTAKALDLTIPSLLLARADQVLE